MEMRLYRRSHLRLHGLGPLCGWNLSKKKIDQRKLEALKLIRGERAEDDASLTKLVSTSNGQGGSCACRGKY
jgi:hypothetical protein